MAQKLKFGNGTWANKEGSTLAYNDEGNNYKPLPFSFERDSIATRVNKEGLIEVVGKDIPRIDYTDSADGVLLLENSATNLFTYSEDFSEFPISNRLVITTNNITSPDGTINASKMQQTDGVTTSPNIAFPNVSAGTYTVSAFAKKGTRSFLAISFNGISYFDLQNGTIATTGSSHTAGIENLGNDWYRCSIVKTISTTQTAAFYFADTNNTLTTDDDEGYMYLYGAQLEQNSFPSSYIPTSGSTVQRAAETANGSGNSEVFNDSEGVLFVDTAALSDDGTNRYISLSDGGVSNRVNIFFDSNNNLRGFYNGLSGSITINTDITLNNKIAFKYKSGNSAFWFNGFEVATRTDALSLSGLNSIAFDLGSGSDFYGKTKEIGYYDEILTDEELEYMTSYRSLNELVTELNLNTL